MKELRELAELEVRIGYQRGQSAGTNTDNDKPRADLVDIAMWNELGTANSPSRPFMRDSVDKHIPAINHMLAAQKDALLEGATAKDIMNTIGLFQQDLIQTEIEQGDFVANAPATIKRKGSDKPLVDTGTMKNSVHYYIVKKGSMD
ncbi:MAG: hypothetical protein HFI60_02205 [Lachnospiraceae bacterium]|nr:hypothetical protein [Lachnospiraceae bacterium]